MAYLKDIAVAAGVSIRTVSRVVKGRGCVGADSRAKIEAAIRKLGYQPSRLAQSLRTRRGYAVALIVWSTDEMHMAKIAAFEGVVRQAGYSVSTVFGCGLDFHKSIDALVDQVLVWNPAGLVVIPGAGDGLAPTAGRLRARNVPLIAVDTEEPGLDAVRIDRRGGVRDAVHYLADKGRARIAYLGTRQDANRVDGYLQALGELGRGPIHIEIPGSEDRHRAGAGVARRHAPLPAWVTAQRDVRVFEHLGHQENLRIQFFEAGRAAVARFLEMSPRPDAVQAFSDVTAAGFLAGLHEHGARVPDDVAVVGFDGRMIATLCWPRLTTLAQPNWEVGAAAAEMVLKKIAGAPPPEGGWRVTIPMRLEVRESA